MPPDTRRPMLSFAYRILRADQTQQQQLRDYFEIDARPEDDLLSTSATYWPARSLKLSFEFQATSGLDYCEL